MIKFPEINTPDTKLAKNLFPAKVKFNEDFNIKLLSRLPVQLKDRVATVEIKSFPDGRNPLYCTVVRDLQNDVMGTHMYSIDQDRGIFEGEKIRTMFKYRGNGVGEVMRLVSIMEMHANNLRKNSIVSLSSAIPFHFRYNFVPDMAISGHSNIRKLLKEIPQSEYCSGEIKYLINRLLEQGLDFSSQSGCFETLNKIIETYVKENIMKRGISGIYRSIGMKLELDTVKKNAEFYNKLFEKHKINYEI